MAQKDSNCESGPSSFWAHQLYTPTQKSLTVLESTENGTMEWPKSTNFYCWNCVHPFPGIPVPIPTHVDIVTNHYVPFGIFCSFECAKRYILEHPSSSMQNDMKNLSIMAKNVFGYHAAIHPAAPPTALQIFGGFLDIDQYRKYSGKIEVISHTATFTSATMIFEAKTLHGVKLSDLAQNANSNSQDPNAPALVKAPRPTTQLFSIRGLRAPKEQKESTSNRSSRVAQKVSEYALFFEKMQKASQILPAEANDSNDSSNQNIVSVADCNISDNSLKEGENEILLHSNSNPNSNPDTISNSNLNPTTNPKKRGRKPKPK